MDKFVTAKENAKVSLGSLGIKKRIQLVQQDLSLSLKSISEKAKREAKTVNKKARKVLAVEDSGQVRDDQVFNCNLDVGHDLCKKFQSNWINIHKASVENAQRAQNVDEVILSILKSWQKWDADVIELHTNLITLPDILTKVEIANSEIQSLGNQIRKLELMMVEYEDLFHRTELAKKKTEETVMLSHLTEQRHMTYQKRKETLQMSAEERKERASSIQQAIERQDSCERQQAYEDAFLQQMNTYIRLGKVETPIAGLVENPTNLADVTIDDADLDTLSEFLGPEELDSVKKSQASLNRSADVMSGSSASNNSQDSIVDNSTVPTSSSEVPSEGTFPQDGADITLCSERITVPKEGIETPKEQTVSEEVGELNKN